MQFTAELMVTPFDEDKRDAQKLYQDWRSARGRILAEITPKLSYWQQLPWKLLQLAHHDSCQAMVGAQICLKLWSQGGLGNKHRQSRRFLDPEFQGDAHGPPLRSLVEKMAAGADIRQPEFQPLVCWLSRFSCIKLVERSVEGTHAVVTRATRRAPAASTAYMSVELRFISFWESLAHKPEAT